MWNVLRTFSQNIPMTVWIHGAEVQPWWRRTYNYQTGEELEHAKHTSQSRLRFWKDIFANHPAHVRFVFVSNYFAHEVMEDVGVVLARRAYEIIHNPVDTERFSYQEKNPEQRKRILSLRPYASRKYANDLSVEAVMKLSEEPYFNELEFKFIGDGPLFDQTLLPIKHYDNVSVEKRFMNPLEIAQLHKEYGVFLCPTRMDSQGVSKDEAMSSGLVPITNAIAAIPEFVDESCAFLAPAEDSSAIAEGIRAVYRDPSLFLQMSRNAATRARNQVSSTRIIPLELELFETKP